MSLSLRASAPPASSSTASPQPVVRSLKAFSLYASPHEETAAMVAARRALMSRKSLSVEEASERARERRRAASQIQRFDRPAWWLALLLPAVGALAWSGSAQGSIAILAAGYALLAVTTVALLARVTRTPEAARMPLDHYYLPDEQLASAEDIALLRRLAQQDSELDAATTAWWRSTAPIRKGDIRLALDFHYARQD